MLHATSRVSFSGLAHVRTSEHTLDLRLSVPCYVGCWWSVPVLVQSGSDSSVQLNRQTALNGPSAQSRSYQARTSIHDTSHPTSPTLLPLLYDTTLLSYGLVQLIEHSALPANQSIDNSPPSEAIDAACHCLPITALLPLSCHSQLLAFTSFFSTVSVDCSLCCLHLRFGLTSSHPLALTLCPPCRHSV